MSLTKSYLQAIQTKRSAGQLTESKRANYLSVFVSTGHLYFGLAAPKMAADALIDAENLCDLVQQ